MFGMAKAPGEAPVTAITPPPPTAVGSAEEAELAELQQLFSSRGPYPPPRDSTIPKTTLAKLKVGEELLLHADEARQEREDRRRVREAQVSERLARAQTRREEAKARAERCKVAREKEFQRKADIVILVCRLPGAGCGGMEAWSTLTSTPAVLALPWVPR